MVTDWASAWPAEPLPPQRSLSDSSNSPDSDADAPFVGPRLPDTSARTATDDDDVTREMIRQLRDEYDRKFVALTVVNSLVIMGMFAYVDFLRNDFRRLVATRTRP